MYREMLPMLNKTRGDHGLQPIPSPKCYFASSNPDILVMENIKDSGFSLIKNKETGRLCSATGLCSLLFQLGSAQSWASLVTELAVTTKSIRYLNNIF